MYGMNASNKAIHSDTLFWQCLMSNFDGLSIGIINAFKYMHFFRNSKKKKKQFSSHFLHAKNFIWHQQFPFSSQTQNWNAFLMSIRFKHHDYYCCLYFTCGAFFLERHVYGLHIDKFAQWIVIKELSHSDLK